MGLCVLHVVFICGFRTEVNGKRKKNAIKLFSHNSPRFVRFSVLTSKTKIHITQNGSTFNNPAFLNIVAYLRLISVIRKKTCLFFLTVWILYGKRLCMCINKLISCFNQAKCEDS